MGATASLPSLAGRSILAVRSGALGDTVLALPALAALRDAVGPEGRLELLGRPPAIELGRGKRLAARVYSIDRAPFRAFYDERVEAGVLVELLASFDVVVSWSRLPRLVALAGPLGVRVIEADPWPPEGVHASDHLMTALAPLGIEGPGDPPELPIDEASRAEARAFLEARGLRPRGFAALHPSSGSPRKNWPPESFGALAGLARESGLDVLWIEGEADEKVVRQAAGGSPEPVARRLELRTLAAVLSEAAVYAGNDSGVSHLAAATSVPTLAFFGPTDPRQWAPRGRSAIVVDWRRSPASAWGFALARIDSH